MKHVKKYDNEKQHYYYNSCSYHYLDSFGREFRQLRCYTRLSENKQSGDGHDQERYPKPAWNALFKNANESGEEWGYRKLVGEIAGSEPMIFVVTLDNDGKVIAYHSVKEHPYYHPY